MASGRIPSASEVLDLMDRLQRDEQRRGELSAGWDIYRAAVRDGIIGQADIDRLAACMQELHRDGLIDFTSQQAGMSVPVPWDGFAIQHLHGWRVTASGRRDAMVYRGAAGPSEEQRGAEGHEAQPGPPTSLDRDLFISHASEDKDAVARPLARALEGQGWSVWLDELELTIGDSLEERINQALVRSRFGVVVLSRAFFGKQWTKRELAGLAAREVASGTKVILPVWHGVTKDDILAFSPVLADRLAASTGDGIDVVAQEISRTLTLAARRGAGHGKAERVIQSVPVAVPNGARCCAR